MNEFLAQLFQAFIPLFVAVDALGMVPLFLGLTSGIAEAPKRRLVTVATLTALGISLVFLVAGKAIFAFMGITESDFKVAGGIVLLILAVMDLLFAEPDKRRAPTREVGVVPIGIPLIMGPAALTTILVSVEVHGYLITIISLLANLLIVWLAFRHAKLMLRVMGEAGSKAFAKVASLFLAAIAVHMIRVGIADFLAK